VIRRLWPMCSACHWRPEPSSALSNHPTSNNPARIPRASTTCKRYLTLNTHRTSLFRTHNHQNPSSKHLMLPRGSLCVGRRLCYGCCKPGHLMSERPKGKPLPRDRTGGVPPRDSGLHPHFKHHTVPEVCRILHGKGLVACLASKAERPVLFVNDVYLIPQVRLVLLVPIYYHSTCAKRITPTVILLLVHTCT
jgi:hypothetical protein